MKLKIFYSILLVIFVLVTSCSDDSVDEIDCSILDLNVTIGECEDGEILAEASGGSPPYEFVLDEVINDDGIFTDLTSGEYSILVTDANGCESTRSVVLNPSLAMDVMPIINLKCSRSSCHLDTQLPLLNSKSAIIAAAPKILTQISMGNMPPNGNITTEESKTLIAWVNCGSNDN